MTGTSTDPGGVDLDDGSAAGGAVGVAVAQFAPGGNEHENLASIVELAGAAASKGAQLVVFPEYSSYFADPVDDRYLEHAEPLDGPFTRALRELADALGIVIVAGLAEMADDPARIRNTVVAVAPHEGLVAVYRKQHLYDAFGAQESAVVEPGSLAAPQTFTVGWLTVGVQTCYDLRFPEVTRTLVDAGAQLVVVPAEWVRGTHKEAHWRTLAAARAIENTVYLAAADQVGPPAIGCSLIVSPLGELLADAGEQRGVAVAWAERDVLERVRSANPALALRRYAVVPKQ
jgi:predicted amidohydrolase